MWSSHFIWFYSCLFDWVWPACCYFIVFFGSHPFNLTSFPHSFCTSVKMFRTFSKRLMCSICSHWLITVITSRCVHLYCWKHLDDSWKQTSNWMSYLHAENARHHDPQNPEDAEQEHLVHCCTVFPAIFLYEEIEERCTGTQLQLYMTTLYTQTWKMAYLSVQQ